MKIVNLISIDIESAAASDVASQTTPRKQDWNFTYSTSRSLPHWKSSFDSVLFTTIDGHVFCSRRVRPRTISLHNGPLTPSAKGG